MEVNQGSMPIWIYSQTITLIETNFACFQILKQPVRHLRVERKLGLDMIGGFLGIFGRIRESGCSNEPHDDFLSTVVGFSSTICCTIRPQRS